MKKDNRIYYGLNKSNKKVRRFVNTTSTKYVRIRNLHINWGVVIAAAIFVLLLTASILTILISPKQQPLPDVVLTESTPENEDSDNIDSDNNFDYLTVSNQRVYQGNLVLVNNSNEYKFLSTDELVSVYENKTSRYKVSSSKLLLADVTVKALNKMFDDFYSDTNCKDILVATAYRSYDEQKSVYYNYIEKYGKADPDDSLASPGCSEHHTGLAVDLSVYTDDGKSFAFGKYNKADWIRSKSADYGFILRYPENKSDITEITYEEYHYRYVGTAHAKIMQYLDMCLEEYIDYIKDYRYDGRYLTLLDDGDVSYMKAGTRQKCPYAIYYVPAKEGETTRVPVPKNTNYEISGNNVDGFIVLISQ